MASSLLNKGICQAACVIAVFAACSATATTIAGFINMGSYHASDIESSVGIWCGLVLFVAVFMGLLLMGTRHKHVAKVYLLVNIICLALAIYGILLSVDYWQDFKEFREYEQAGKCSLTTVNGRQQCICAPEQLNVIKLFLDGYSIEKCPMYALGEDLWLAMIVLVSTCILWSVAGVVIALGAIFTKYGSDKEGY